MIFPLGHVFYSCFIPHIFTNSILHRNGLWRTLMLQHVGYKIIPASLNSFTKFSFLILTNCRLSSKYLLISTFSPTMIFSPLLCSTTYQMLLIFSLQHFQLCPLHIHTKQPSIHKPSITFTDLYICVIRGK